MIFKGELVCNVEEPLCEACGVKEDKDKTLYWMMMMRPRSQCEQMRQLNCGLVDAVENSA